MTPEDHLQIAVMDYLRLQYPDVLSVHIANERHTSPQRGALLKRKGVRAGMPDVMVFQVSLEWVKDEIPMVRTPGLAIELKVGKNRLTQAQFDVMEQLTDNWWIYHVCRSFDEAKEVIDTYLNRC
jgi:hypothetical protein